jgi:hypothetical protein
VRVLNKYCDEIPTNAVWVGRPSVFGNPYRLYREPQRREVIESYRAYFAERIKTDLEFRRSVESLRGRDLVCVCAPKECHADVILAYLETSQCTR